MMLDSKTKDYINKKYALLNNEDFSCEYVSIVIKRLNDFINEDIQLTNAEVEGYLSNLVSNFTTALYMPIDPGMKLLRARPYSIPHLESNTQELSYIPNDKP